MNSSGNLLDRLAQKAPSGESQLCVELQSRALEVLAGEKLPSHLQEHRESCLVCISHLRKVMSKIKAVLPEVRGVKIWRQDELGHAAGATHTWRSLSESQIVKAGFSAGWHLDVQIESEDEYRLTLVSDLMRRVRLTLLNDEGESLAVLELNKMPTYLDRSLAEKSHGFVLEELD